MSRIHLVVKIEHFGLTYTVWVIGFFTRYLDFQRKFYLHRRQKCPIKRCNSRWNL